MTSAIDIEALVDGDLSNLRDPRVRASIETVRLPTPAPIRLAWDYEPAGEMFDGWLVLNDPGHQTGIVYCEKGFGPTSPWGLVNTHTTCPSMGMDSGWFQRFIDACFDSFTVTDLPIWRVVRRLKENRLGEYITAELSWEEAWTVVERLRAEDSTYAFDCEHNVAY